MAVAGPFRILYKPQEKTSFMAIMKLLISHVRSDSVRRPEALDELRDLRKGRAEILSRSTIRMILERRQADGSVLEDIMTTERLIDLWLHGHFLHGDRARRRTSTSGTSVGSRCLSSALRSGDLRICSATGAS